MLDMEVRRVLAAVSKIRRIKELGPASILQTKIYSRIFFVIVSFDVILNTPYLSFRALNPGISIQLCT